MTMHDLLQRLALNFNCYFQYVILINIHVGGHNFVVRLDINFYLNFIIIYFFFLIRIVKHFFLFTLNTIANLNLLANI